MIEYIYKAAITWFIGFFPYFEIYIATPAGLFIGLDTFSAIFWSVLGNFSAIPVVSIFYDKLIKNKFFKNWLAKTKEKSSNSKVQYFKKNDILFIVLLTPIIGVWAVAIMGKIRKTNCWHLYIYSFVSILLYAIILTILIKTGISAIPTDSLPSWLLIDM